MTCGTRLKAQNGWALMVFIVITATVLLPAVPTLAQGVPTAITYQGKITDTAGQPLPDGSSAMQFKLFDAENGGSQLWDSGAMNVGVRGGVFSVVLGASPTPPVTSSVLSSESIWLEVKVGSDEPLPRTKLSSAPFALRAAVAETVADNSVTSAKIADGTIQLGDLGQNGASANQVIKRNSANTAWTVADDNDTSYWSESSGNVYRPSGNVGIGLTNPNRKLYVAESTDGLSYPVKIDNPHSTAGDATGILFSAGGDGSNNLNTTRGKGALVYEYKSTWNRGDFHFLQESSANANNPTLANAALTIKNNGSVGLGTTSPSQRLHIASGDGLIAGSSNFSSGTEARLLLGDSNNYIKAVNGSGLRLGAFGAADGLVLKNGGNVGIGTTDPANKLHLSGSGGAMIRMDGEGAGMTGLKLTQGGTAHWSLFVRKWESNNLIIRDEAAGTDTMVFPTGTGKVGVGTANPDAKLHVAAGSGKALYGKVTNVPGVIGYGVYGEAGYNDGKGVYGLNVTNNNYGYLGANDRGTYGRHSNGNAGSLGGSDYGVRADGDLVVTGAYRGNIGPNNGAPFPRPAYDSGWTSLTPGVGINLYHNLGGNVDNYVVDMMFRKQIAAGVYQIHNVGLGHDFFDYDHHYYETYGSGAHYRYLDNSRLIVERGAADWHCEQVRVRIWVYN